MPNLSSSTRAPLWPAKANGAPPLPSAPSERVHHLVPLGASSSDARSGNSTHATDRDKEDTSSPHAVFTRSVMSSGNASPSPSSPPPAGPVRCATSSSAAAAALPTAAGGERDTEGSPATRYANNTRQMPFVNDVVSSCSSNSVSNLYDPDHGFVQSEGKAAKEDDDGGIEERAAAHARQRPPMRTGGGYANLKEADGIAPPRSFAAAATVAGCGGYASHNQNPALAPPRPGHRQQPQLPPPQQQQQQQPMENFGSRGTLLSAVADIESIFSVLQQQKQQQQQLQAESHRGRRRSSGKTRTDSEGSAHAGEGGTTTTSSSRGLGNMHSHSGTTATTSGSSASFPKSVMVAEESSLSAGAADASRLSLLHLASTNTYHPNGNSASRQTLPSGSPMVTPSPRAEGKPPMRQGSPQATSGEARSGAQAEEEEEEEDGEATVTGYFTTHFRTMQNERLRNMLNARLRSLLLMTERIALRCRINLDLCVSVQVLEAAADPTTHHSLASFSFATPQESFPCPASAMAHRARGGVTEMAAKVQRQAAGGSGHTQAGEEGDEPAEEDSALCFLPRRRSTTSSGSTGSRRHPHWDAGPYAFPDVSRAGSNRDNADGLDTVRTTNSATTTNTGSSRTTATTGSLAGRGFLSLHHGQQRGRHSDTRGGDGHRQGRHPAITRTDDRTSATRRRPRRARSVPTPRRHHYFTDSIHEERSSEGHEEGASTSRNTLDSKRNSQSNSHINSRSHSNSDGVYVVDVTTSPAPRVQPVHVPQHSSQNCPYTRHPSAGRRWNSSSSTSRHSGSGSSGGTYVVYTHHPTSSSGTPNAMVGGSTGGGGGNGSGGHSGGVVNSQSSSLSTHVNSVGSQHFANEPPLHQPPPPPQHHTYTLPSSIRQMSNVMQPYLPTAHSFSGPSSFYSSSQSRVGGGVSLTVYSEDNYSMSGNSSHLERVPYARERRPTAPLLPTPPIPAVPMVVAAPAAAAAGTESKTAPIIAHAPPQVHMSPADMLPPTSFPPKPPTPRLPGRKSERNELLLFGGRGAPAYPPGQPQQQLHHEDEDEERDDDTLSISAFPARYRTRHSMEDSLAAAMASIRREAGEHAEGIAGEGVGKDSTTTEHPGEEAAQTHRGSEETREPAAAAATVTVAPAAAAAAVSGEGRGDESTEAEDRQLEQRQPAAMATSAEESLAAAPSARKGPAALVSEVAAIAPHHVTGGGEDTLASSPQVPPASSQQLLLGRDLDGAGATPLTAELTAPPSERTGSTKGPLEQEDDPGSDDDDAVAMEEEVEEDSNDHKTPSAGDLGHSSGHPVAEASEITTDQPPSALATPPTTTATATTPTAWDSWSDQPPLHHKSSAPPPLTTPSNAVSAAVASPPSSVAGQSLKKKHSSESNLASSDSAGQMGSENYPRRSGSSHKTGQDGGVRRPPRRGQGWQPSESREATRSAVATSGAAPATSGLSSPSAPLSHTMTESTLTEATNTTTTLGTTAGAESNHNAVVAADVTETGARQDQQQDQQQQQPQPRCSPSVQSPNTSGTSAAERHRRQRKEGSSGTGGGGGGTEREAAAHDAKTLSLPNSGVTGFASQQPPLVPYPSLPSTGTAAVATTGDSPRCGHTAGEVPAVPLSVHPLLPHFPSLPVEEAVAGVQAGGSGTNRLLPVAVVHEGWLDPEGTLRDSLDEDFSRGGGADSENDRDSVWRHGCPPPNATPNTQNRHPADEHAATEKEEGEGEGEGGRGRRTGGTGDASCGNSNNSGNNEGRVQKAAQGSLCNEDDGAAAAWEPAAEAPTHSHPQQQQDAAPPPPPPPLHRSLTFPPYAGLSAHRHSPSSSRAPNSANAASGAAGSPGGNSEGSEKSGQQRTESLAAPLDSAVMAAVEERSHTSSGGFDRREDPSPALSGCVSATTRTGDSISASTGLSPQTMSGSYVGMACPTLELSGATPAPWAGGLGAVERIHSHHHHSSRGQTPRGLPSPKRTTDKDSDATAATEKHGRAAVDMLLSGAKPNAAADEKTASRADLISAAATQEAKDKDEVPPASAADGAVASSDSLLFPCHNNNNSSNSNSNIAAAATGHNANGSSTMKDTTDSGNVSAGAEIGEERARTQGGDRSGSNSFSAASVREKGEPERAPPGAGTPRGSTAGASSNTPTELLHLPMPSFYSSQLQRFIEGKARHEQEWRDHHLSSSTNSTNSAGAVGGTLPLTASRLSSGNERPKRGERKEDELAGRQRADEAAAVEAAGAAAAQLVVAVAEEAERGEREEEETITVPALIQQPQPPPPPPPPTHEDGNNDSRFHAVHTGRSEEDTLTSRRSTSEGSRSAVDGHGSTDLMSSSSATGEYMTRRREEDIDALLTLLNQKLAATPSTTPANAQAEPPEQPPPPSPRAQDGSAGGTDTSTHDAMAPTTRRTPSSSVQLHAGAAPGYSTERVLSPLSDAQADPHTTGPLPSSSSAPPPPPPLGSITEGVARLCPGPLARESSSEIFYCSPVTVSPVTMSLTTTAGQSVSFGRWAAGGMGGGGSPLGHSSLITPDPTRTATVAGVSSGVAGGGERAALSRSSLSPGGGGGGEGIEVLGSSSTLGGGRSPSASWPRLRSTSPGLLQSRQPLHSQQQQQQQRSAAASLGGNGGNESDVPSVSVSVSVDLSERDWAGGGISRASTAGGLQQQLPHRYHGNVNGNGGQFDTVNVATPLSIGSVSPATGVATATWGVGVGPESPPTQGNSNHNAGGGGGHTHAFSTAASKGHTVSGSSRSSGQPKHQRHHRQNEQQSVVKQDGDRHDDNRTGARPPSGSHLSSATNSSTGGGSGRWSPSAEVKVTGENSEVSWGMGDGNSTDSIDHLVQYMEPPMTTASSLENNEAAQQALSEEIVEAERRRRQVDSTTTLPPPKEEGTPPPHPMDLAPDHYHNDRLGTTATMTHFSTIPPPSTVSSSAVETAGPQGTGHTSRGGGGGGDGDLPEDDGEEGKGSSHPALGCSQDSGAEPEGRSRGESDDHTTVSEEAGRPGHAGECAGHPASMASPLPATTAPGRGATAVLPDYTYYAALGRQHPYFTYHLLGDPAPTSSASPPPSRRLSSFPSSRAPHADGGGGSPHRTDPHLPHPASSGYTGSQTGASVGRAAALSWRCARRTDDDALNLLPSGQRRGSGTQPSSAYFP